MHAHPQVYADLAGIDWITPRVEFHEYLRRLLQHGDGCKLAERLMFGSDQVAWPEAIGMAIAGIESADFLTEEQKRDISAATRLAFCALSPRFASSGQMRNGERAILGHGLQTTEES